MTGIPNFTATRDEIALIDRIVARATDIARRQSEQSERFDAGTFRRALMMDLEAVHCNGTPLNFQVLLDFPPFDFTHDIAGIQEHIDRTTGELGDFFSPRCAQVYHP